MVIAGTEAAHTDAEAERQSKCANQLQAARARAAGQRTKALARFVPTPEPKPVAKEEEKKAAEQRTAGEPVPAHIARAESIKRRLSRTESSRTGDAAQLNRAQSFTGQPAAS